MSFEPTPPSSAESDARDIAMLQELAEITFALSRALGQQALDKAAEGEAEAAGNLSIVVTKVGRALRQTIAFRRKIEEAVRAGEDKRAAGQSEGQAFARRGRSVNRKHMIRRAMEQVLSSQQAGDEEEDETGGEETEGEVRFDELYERLDEYESFTDFTERPVSAFIANLCNAMGLEFDWSQFEYEPWAMREAETKAEGSPFAAWWASTYPDPADDPPDADRLSGTGPPLAAE